MRQQHTSFSFFFLIFCSFFHHTSGYVLFSNEIDYKSALISIRHPCEIYRPHQVEPNSYNSANRSLFEILSMRPEILSLLQGSFQDIDTIGNPTQFHFSHLGTFSAGLLYHTRSITELIHLFDTVDDRSILECTTGYGAECALLYRLCKSYGWKWKSYTIVTYPQQTTLITWFLAQMGVEGVTVISIDDVDTAPQADIVFLASVGLGHFTHARQEKIFYDILLPANNVLMRLSTIYSALDTTEIIQRATIQSHLIQKKPHWKKVRQLEPDFGAYIQISWKEK